MKKGLTVFASVFLAICFAVGCAGTAERDDGESDDFASPQDSSSEDPEISFESSGIFTSSSSENILDSSSASLAEDSSESFSDSTSETSSDISSDSSSEVSSDSSASFSQESSTPVQEKVHIVFHRNFEPLGTDIDYSVSQFPGILNSEAVERVMEKSVMRGLKDKFLTETNDEEPLFFVSGWAYDEEGKDSFEGTVQAQEEELHLYAVWERSAEYCEIALIGENTENIGTYYGRRGTVLTKSAEEKLLAVFSAYYGTLGLIAEGLETSDGKKFGAGDVLETDMQIFARLSIPKEGKKNE